MDFDFLISEKKYQVTINKKEDKYEIYVDDELILTQPIHHLSNFISLDDNGVNRKAFFSRDNGIQYIFIDGVQYRVEDLSQAEQNAVAKDHSSLEHEAEICAPMPGKILKILVKQGDEIELKQNLVIVEAMKMENNINSPIKGRVKKINYKVGDIVDTGQPIIELEALE
jgi:biotin carboxyl carrier protein